MIEQLMQHSGKLRPLPRKDEGDAHAAVSLSEE
jgi:hypothetical protein